jgi:hypothetical protein
VETYTRKDYYNNVTANVEDGFLVFWFHRNQGCAHHFVGPDPAVEVSRQYIRRTVQCWMSRQHLVRWRGLVGTMRQARELISVRNTAARTALMSFNLLKPSGNFTYHQV